MNKMSKESQPLTESKALGKHRRAPKRTGSSKPPQHNMHGVSKCKP